MKAYFIVTLSLFFLLSITFVSCNKATPACFWKKFDARFLINNISDQGPYGGHRAMYWKTDRANYFNSVDVLLFAQRNGWTFLDSSNFSQEQTRRWIYNGKRVFPLTSTGFSDSVLDDAHLTDFPRWFGGQVSIYKFKTGWITIKHGTDDFVEENGFVVIKHNKAEMAVYHLWGE
jgi:hypothetical protein